ncbi:hypothetical protein Moror_16393 [Moniliophthora roreri MCA 2997]|uniref:F-box domain-containing protein n=1 Tax=Moniliophthora roreri (strain MCA 2997) TaxID=1381753 RepID=V2XEQ3_MONRO|nr:hypothetical protein Moror_16393 [Moniliophthora roreri MCA 2997]
MPRRSSRLEAKRQPQIAPQPKPKTIQREAEVEQCEKNKWTSRGLLQKFAKEAPLDIMLEIFTYLQIQDLLHLTRTSKELRGMFLSRSCLQIWRAAIKNSDLPPSPEDMCEPEYASLAFDSRCAVCGYGPCENIAWECRIRCHKTCARKYLYCQDLLRKLPTWSEGVQEMVQQDVIRFIPRVRTAKEYAIIGRYRWIDKGNANFFIPKVFNSYRLEFLEVKGDPEELKKWCKQKGDEYEKLRTHDIQCRIWHTKFKAQRERENAQERHEKRKDQILSRLVTLGWDAQDLQRPQIMQHPLVNRSKVLTDEEWSWIESTLVEFVQNENVRRGHGA